MGGGSSKVDNYVLKVLDDTFPVDFEHKSKSLHKNKIGISSNNNELLKQKSMSRRNSTDNPELSPRGMLEKKGVSSKNLNSDELHLMNSKPQLLKQSSSSKLSHQLSSSKLVKTNSIILKSSNTTHSAQYHWLMKNANLAGTSLNDYELGRVIGTGLMGTVRITKSKKNDKYLVLKGVRKDFIFKHNDQRHIQNEKEVLKTLNCSFCVKLFGTFQDKNNVYFALEYCPGGELFARLGRKKAFPPPVAKFYTHEIFVALEHVQEKGFVYRDLKPENVLLDEEGHIKLVDFGFSCPCIDDSTKLHTLCGTPAYLSPEQLDGKFTNGYTRVVDWWSFGVVIYELLTGKTPFCRSNKESHYEIFLRILKMKISFPWGFDSISKDLITKLCHAQLDKRLCNATDIKQHNFFEISWDKVAARQLIPPFVPRIKDEGDIHYFRNYPASTNDNIIGDEVDSKYGFLDF